MTGRLVARVPSVVERMMMGPYLDFGERFRAEVHRPSRSLVRRVSKDPTVALVALAAYDAERRHLQKLTRPYLSFKDEKLGRCPR